jgi:hypothetical protein
VVACDSSEILWQISLRTLLACSGIDPSTVQNGRRVVTGFGIIELLVHAVLTNCFWKEISVVRKDDTEFNGMMGISNLESRLSYIRTKRLVAGSLV